MSKYDFVVIGAGHNGLVAACYLAKAGFDVCVLEGEEKIGGGVRTEEVTVPGFKHDLASMMHGLINSNPLLVKDELGLKSKYGLEYVYPEKVFASVFPDNTCLVMQRSLDATCQEIAQVSEKDAERYLEFYKYLLNMLKVARIGMFSPPPKWGNMNAVFDASPEGREFLRIMLSSCQDIVSEWFESELVRTTITRFATEIMIGPDEKGTGAAIFFVANLHNTGFPLPVGGSGRLVESLAACLKDLGGEIRVSSRVTDVLVKDGKATGVKLATGEEIEAKKGVISCAHPKDLFLSMLPPKEVGTETLRKIRNIKPATFSAVNQAFALKEAPNFKVSDKANEAFFVEINPFEKEYLQIFDGFKYGIPSHKMPLMLTPSKFDPTRAPDGKCTFGIYHYNPYNLNGVARNWDSYKQRIADDILEYASNFCTNLNDSNILGRWVATPLDIERMNPSMKDGDFGHIGQYITQSYANRPVSGFGQYRTCIKNLYLCGAGTHPGIGVSGGGRNTAQVILEDYGIDFKKVVN